MNARVHQLIAVFSIVFLPVGVILSHRLEPGVRVETVTLAGDIPALRFLPTSSGPHPTALLAHGATASKETLFRFGEALAAAGFACLAVDFPGHGASSQVFSANETVGTVEAAARTMGSVDIFLGHSMGAAAGSVAAHHGTLRPRLFIAVGANPDVGEQGPPLLLMAGQFEELVPLKQLKARTDARLVLSPWSDHALEPYDPFLVNAAVAAACAVVGQTPPVVPTAWIWRVAGVVVSLLGAVGLMVCLPQLIPRVMPLRGLLVPLISIVTVILTLGTWFGIAPEWHRVPVQLAMMLLIWVSLTGVGKLGIPRWNLPRWSLPASGALLTIVWATAGQMIFRFGVLSIVFAITTLFLFAGMVLAKLATHRGSRRDGDMAMAIFAGYLIGQWIPRLL